VNATGDFLVFYDMGTADQLKWEIAVSGLGRFVVECQQMPAYHDWRLRLKVQAVRYVGWCRSDGDLNKFLTT
jgi:hypothetical protein